MARREIILEHKGHLSFETVGDLLNELKSKMYELDVGILIYKKIVSIMVESLENIYKNIDGLETEFEKINHYPKFVLERDDKQFFLTAANPILNENIEKLKNRIDRVNLLDRKGLKSLYKKTITDGRFSNKGGAGLGIITMAKSSGNKIKYDFKTINDKMSYFQIQIHISSKEI